MKKIILISLIGITSLLISSARSVAQVMVKVKPLPPKAHMHAPPKPGPDFVLIPGHWIWSRHVKMYQWVAPNWVPVKDDRKWVPGHWKELPKGWKWIPGRWERADKRRYFFK